MGGGFRLYLGQQKEGALGLIDGTECKPTYGATLNDVRGFVQGGFPALNNNEGDISHYGDEFKIDFQDLEILVKNDTIKPGIVIVHDSPLGSSSSFNMPKNLNFDIQPICLKFPFQDINQNPKTPKQQKKETVVTTKIDPTLRSHSSVILNNPTNLTIQKIKIT